MNKKFSFSRKRNRQFEFSPKLQWALAAERSEAVVSDLPFPFWCRILELVRTSRAAGGGGGGAAHPAQKMPDAAKPLRSKTAKEPGEKHRRKPFSFGVRQAHSAFISGKRKLFVIRNAIIFGFVILAITWQSIERVGYSDACHDAFMVVLPTGSVS